MTTTTIVNYCGSRWAGEKHATLDDLFACLASHPLITRGSLSGIVYHAIRDWTDEETGKRWTRCAGNFQDVSHAFSVDTDDPEVIARLSELVRANRDIQPHPCVRRRATGDDARCPCWESHFSHMGEARMPDCDACGRPVDSAEQTVCAGCRTGSK